MFSKDTADVLGINATPETSAKCVGKGLSLIHLRAAGVIQACIDARMIPWELTEAAFERLSQQ